MANSSSSPRLVRQPASAEKIHAELSYLIESNDFVAGALLRLIGAADLLAVIHRKDWYPADLEARVISELGLAATGGAPSMRSALQRWRKRLGYAPAPQYLLDAIHRVGGGIVLPEDAAWPGQLADLGHGAPLCLWWRGDDVGRLLHQQVSGNVAIVGSRDSSDYGNQVTGELAGGLAREGACIVSGGAYGIDAAAHRAALQAETSDASRAPTIAILAGGLDRLYPAGNANLLNQVIQRGLLLSEVPPGTAPARFRFLNRNRLISAFCHLTVVTEARFRSGALNTAHQALELGREVAAMPGSVFSPNSVGTHRLIRAGEAALITNAHDALELLPQAAGQPARLDNGAESARACDGLTRPQALVLDVLSRSRALSVDELCAGCGLQVTAVLCALQVLAARGQARQEAGAWRRVGR